MISMNVIIQKKRPRALSVSAAPSQLSQRESQGRLLGTVSNAKNALESHHIVRFKSVFIVTQRNCFRKNQPHENTEQKLPLRGSWLGAAETDEGRGAT